MTSRTALLYVARGDSSFAGVAAAIDQIAAWTALHRLKFVVLAGSRCFMEYANSPWSSDERLEVVNATDAAIWQRLSSPAAHAWFRHTAAMGGKQHTYTVPKLFLYELLPAHYELAITLDNDVVPLADVAHLADHVEAVARSDRHAALFYASEQQNKYRWVLNWTRAVPEGQPWPAARNGINGGVGVQLLNRLRASDTYSHSECRGIPICDAWPHTEPPRQLQ